MTTGLCLGNATLPMKPLHPHATPWLCPVENFAFLLRLIMTHGRHCTYFLYWRLGFSIWVVLWNRHLAPLIQALKRVSIRELILTYLK